jgi:hypothetical protein
MYRSCIFCSAPLGSNESIERFPVGRSLAFDAAKGRLWAVCPRCARWNLAPIEERWEAIEDAERLFRDTRLRVQRENIGLAKLRDGTRLIRVGEALPGELAAWRYGKTFSRRGTRAALVAGTGGVATLAGVAGALSAGLGVLGVYGGLSVGAGIMGAFQWHEERRVVQRLSRPGALEGEPLTVRHRDLRGATLVQAQDEDLGLHLPMLNWNRRRQPLTVTGQAARTLLARAMVHVNDQATRKNEVDAALKEVAGSPEAFLQNAAKAGHKLVSLSGDRTGQMPNLALEMALHEETERRALDGELAMLEAMWRDAEEIAAIADRLPDVPAPDPPKLTAG